MLKICDKYKKNSLQKASESVSRSTVQLIFDKKANINSVVFKENPLHKASEKGHERNVQLLLD